MNLAAIAAVLEKEERVGFEWSVNGKDRTSFDRNRLSKPILVGELEGGRRWVGPLHTGGMVETLELGGCTLRHVFERERVRLVLVLLGAYFTLACAQCHNVVAVVPVVLGGGLLGRLGDLVLGSLVLGG